MTVFMKCFYYCVYTLLILYYFKLTIARTWMCASLASLYYTLIGNRFLQVCIGGYLLYVCIGGRK